MVTASLAAQTAPPIPRLVHTGSHYELLVNGKPFLMLGGQAHNSSASNPQDLEPVWRSLVAMHANTAEVPLYWELIEPQPEHFDFHLIDSIIEAGPLTRKFPNYFVYNAADKTYRFAQNVKGNVLAEQISQMATQPLGVKSVINPLAASGGADRDSADRARHNAPLAVMALDRLVAVRDYADFGRVFAGLWQARGGRLNEWGGLGG